ncbi:unnamed protein product [Bathycoccus prasinos]
MRNLIPSSRSLARTKTFFSSSFTVREDEFDKSGFVGGEDEESQRRRRKSQQRKTTNTISCAPSLDEERKHVFVCLESGHVVRARCFVENGKEEEEEEHDAKKTKRRMILLKDTEEEDEEDEENKSKSKKRRRNAVSVERLPELRATFVALERGELLLVNDSSFSSSSSSSSSLDVERVADVPSGCVSAKFSPDGQMCAVLTKSGKILIMNGDFYLLNERESCLEDVDEEEEEEEETIKSGKITWRNDGESFCVYCTTLKDGKNHLRTYSRDKLEILGRGDVDHEDDETGPGRMGENAAIAWQPRGALIAVSGVAASSSRNSTNNNAEKEEEKVPCVVFYEKNGLRRSSLLMRGFQGSKITHLSWSVDSLTLAISTYDKEKLRSAASIWTRGNANWTCKRCIEDSYSSNNADDGEIYASLSKYAEFDAIHPNTLRIVSTNGENEVEVNTQTFVWEDCTSSDLGTAAVIDGEILKLTPFSRCVVPPPMCDHSLRFPAKISEVAWRPNAFRRSLENDEEDEVCFVSLHDGRYKVVRVNGNAEAEELFDERNDKKSVVEETMTMPFSLEKRDEFRSYCWIGANALACVSSTNESIIHKIELDDEYSKIVKVSVIELENTRRGRVVTKLAHCCNGNDDDKDGLLVAFVAGEKTPLIFSTSDAKQLNIATSTPSDENVITHELHKAKALANGQVVALYSNGDLFLYRILGGDDDKRLLLMKNVDSFEAFYEDENNTWVKSCDAEGRKQYYKTVSTPNAIACVSRDSKLRVVRLSLSNNKSSAAVVDQLSKSLESQAFFNNIIDPVAARRNWKDVSGDGKTRLGELAFDSLHGKMRAAMRPDDADFATPSSSVAANAGANFADMAKRSVERGSRIAAIPPGSCTVVLQQPRGNLEIISPKALVLPSIAKSLKMRHFKTAFRLCSKERVDLNVLIDYDFPSSIEHPNADDLVRGLETPEHVMELLEALRVGDAFAEDGGYMRKLCASAYAECPDRKQMLEDLGVQKIRRTCEAIRTSISNLYMNAGDGTSRWSLAMLTSYACGTGSFLDTHAESNKKDNNDVLSIKAAKRKDLADALEIVAEVRAFEIKDASNKAMSTKNVSASSVAAANDVMNSDSSDADETEFIGAQFTKQTVSAARMLKHLLFLTNDRELFDAALSTGDLAVAHLVAMNSQAMDPGEFMPELQHLHEMREFERQATISERLEMWKDAAKFWLKDKSLEKASNVAAKHGLFPYLHELCEEDENGDDFETKKVITKYHARYLESVVNRSEDAGVAYLKCGDYESALRCFTGVSSSSSSSSKSTGSGSSSWRSGFIVAKEKLKFSDEEMVKLASETCKNLEQASNDYVSAAVIALDYLNDVERAVANFALANKWRDAKLTCFAKNRSDVFETTVFPECVVGATKLLEHFEDVQARSDKYKERLIGLQERRKLYKRTFASIEEGRTRPRRATLDGSEDEEYDDISEMNSEFSNVSGYSLYATSTQFGDGSAISQQSSSRWSASTVGGRRNKKSRKNKNKKNKNGLRAGGPTEERDLSTHVITEVRVSEEKLEECAEICEILIASDNGSDAKVLQNAASMAIEKCKLMRVAARESLKQLIEEKEKEEEYIVLVSSSSNNNVLPPELMERKREIEADLKTMRESMNANAKDDEDVVSYKWSSIRTSAK